MLNLPESTSRALQVGKPITANVDVLFLSSVNVRYIIYFKKTWVNIYSVIFLIYLKM